MRAPPLALDFGKPQACARGPEVHASPGEEVERKPLAYHVQTSELPLGLPPELIGWDSFFKPVSEPACAWRWSAAFESD